MQPVQGFPRRIPVVDVHSAISIMTGIQTF